MNVTRARPVLVLGWLPGVVAGSVIRVELLPGPHVFDLVAGAVPASLGLWLALTRPPGVGGRDRPVRMISGPVLVALSAAVGCVGGIYGIGGGSILAPVLIGSGPQGVRGRPRCPGLYLHDLGRRGDHVHDPGRPRAWLRGS
jgi:hypothetical protein